MSRLYRIVLIFLAIIVCAKAGASTAKVSTVTKPSVVKKEENIVERFLDTIVDATKGQTVNAAVKDTTVNGLEGLNIVWEVPFKIQDYIVGFKYNIGDLKKTPEKLFAKKSFLTSGDGTATIDADYFVADKVFGLKGTWESDKFGFSVTAEGDSKDRLTDVSLTSTQSINNGAKVTLKAAYDLLKKKINFVGKANNDDITGKIAYNSIDQDPIFTVSKKLDANNEVSPSISLKTGDISYKWDRKVTGGSISADFHPGDNLVLEWTDQGSNGEWTTKADIPVDNQANTKISFSRKWTY